MVKIRINKKKIVESAPALSGVGLFKISGEWFIASTQTTSPLQEHLILVNPSIFLEIIKKEKNLYLNFNKNLACRVSKKIVESNGVLGLASYDSAEALGHGTCSGAMELMRLAGSGYGEKLFRLSMASVYPRPLTIDRESVSGDLTVSGVKGAKAVVAKIDSDSSAVKYPKNHLKYIPSDEEVKAQIKSKRKFPGSIDVYDDISDPITEPEQDDCLITYYANKALNRGFASNKANGELNGLLSSGEVLKNEVISLLKDEKAFNLILRYTSVNFFDMKFLGKYRLNCR
jgi:hypothetical protein